MKNNILVVVLLTVLCLGCGREERDHITQRGKEIHDTWFNCTQYILSESVLPAFQLSAYLAANDSLGRVIMDQCFGSQHIWQDDENVYGIYENGECQLSINTNGTLLTDEGATWQITSLQNNYGYWPRPLFAGPFHLHTTLSITHLAGNQWKIALDSVSYQGTTADWLLTLPSGTPLQDICFSAFTLSGTGAYYFEEPEYGSAKDDDPVLLHYAIENPLQKDKSFFGFNAGDIQYVATKENQEDILVSAKFIGGGSVKITYRDFTETWSDYIYYYE